MKKKTIRIVCATALLTAVLTLGQQMFTKDRDARGDQSASTRPSPVTNITARGHSSTPRIRNEAEIIGIGEGISNLPIGNSDVALVKEPAIDNGDSLSNGENDYIAYNPGYNEEITGYHGLKNDNSAHTGPSTGALHGAAGFPSKKTDQPYTSPIGNAGNGGGGYVGPGAGKDRKNVENEHDTSNTPGTDTSPNADRGDSKPNGNDNKPTGTQKPSDKEAPTGTGTDADGTTDPKDKADTSPGDSTPANKDQSKDQAVPSGSPDTENQTLPHFSDCPPGQLGNIFCSPVPTQKIGNQGHEGEKISDTPGETTVSEPAGILLIGLGGIVLLWSQRRISQS